MALRVDAFQAEEIALAGWAQAIKHSALQEMLAKASAPGILSFALGLPAQELFPTEALAHAATQVLAADRRALQYSPPHRPLKSHIVNLMAERGVTCTEEQVFLTAGAQQGMNLLARLLLEPAGQVIFEELSYTGFQQVIEPYQPEMLTVSTNGASGMALDEVERLLEDGARPSLIYAISDGHNPLGVSLSAESRRRLAELARHYRVPIMEDDAYGFLHYEDQVLPPLRALDERWVFYVGSFSKILAPSLRVGWLIVPEALQEKLAIVKEAADINSHTFTQRVITAFLDAGCLPAHIDLLRREYRARRNTMLQALQEHLSGQARWNVPSSGLFVWVELDKGRDTGKLLKVALEAEQIAFIPGRAFSIHNRPGAAHCLRLNFSNCPAQRIEEGIARLARVLQV